MPDGEPRVWRSRSGYTVLVQRPSGADANAPLLYVAWAPSPPPEDDAPPRSGCLGTHETFAVASEACRRHWSGR